MKNNFFKRLTAIIMVLIFLTAINVTAMDEVLPDLVAVITVQTEDTRVSEIHTCLEEELQPMASTDCPPPPEPHTHYSVPMWYSWCPKCGQLYGVWVVTCNKNCGTWQETKSCACVKPGDLD